MNQIIIKKGILFYDGEQFQPRLKKAKFYTTFNEANKIKNNLADTGIEVLRFWQYTKKVARKIRDFKTKSTHICQTKAEYRTYKKALVSKNRMEKRLKKDTLVVFKCQNCKYYHIGSFDGYSEYYKNLIKDLSKLSV